MLAVLSFVQYVYSIVYMQCGAVELYFLAQFIGVLSGKHWKVHAILGLLCTLYSTRAGTYHHIKSQLRRSYFPFCLSPSPRRRKVSPPPLPTFSFFSRPFFMKRRHFKRAER